MESQEQESVSGQDIFNDAISDTPAQEQTQNIPEKATEAPTEAKGGRARDEKGRFAPAKEEEPEKVEAQPEPVPQVEVPKEEPEKQDHRVPLAELLNTRDRAQKAEAEREQLRQALWQMQSQLKQLQTPNPEPVDIFADPQGWEKTFEQRTQAKLREMEGNFSLRLAAYKYGDSFTEAWKAMTERTQMGDDSFRQQVLNSPDPGETLVQLYKREKVISEVGTDPEAYAARILEEALNNPEYVAKAVERFKGTAAKAQPQTQVKLPPSLNTAPGSAPPGDQGDMSGQSLYSFATGR